jgi:hypothetical protein
MSLWTFFWGCASILTGLYYLIFKRNEVKNWPYEKKAILYMGLIFVSGTFIISLIVWIFS